jgi:hypothetical protein
VIILPHGESHTMCSHPGTKAAPVRAVFSQGSLNATPASRLRRRGQKVSIYLPLPELRSAV